MNRRRFLVALAAIPAALVVPKLPVTRWDANLRQLRIDELGQVLLAPITPAERAFLSTTLQTPLLANSWDAYFKAREDEANKLMGRSLQTVR